MGTGSRAARRSKLIDTHLYIRDSNTVVTLYRLRLMLMMIPGGEMELSAACLHSVPDAETSGVWRGLGWSSSTRSPRSLRKKSEPGSNLCMESVRGCATASLEDEAGEMVEGPDWIVEVIVDGWYTTEDVFVDGRNAVVRVMQDVECWSEVPETVPNREKEQNNKQNRPTLHAETEIPVSRSPRCVRMSGHEEGPVILTVRGVASLSTAAQRIVHAHPDVLQVNRERECVL